jgi:receptor protein-tyrosine kinase
MNAEITDSVEHDADDLHGPDDRLTDALVAHLGLSQEDVARITEIMQAQQISFEAAACQLNLATQKDTADVKAWLRGHATSSSGSGGIFEKAVHNVRFNNSTALTVRRGVVKQGNLLQHTNIIGDPRNEQISALRTDLMLLNDSAQRSNVFAFVSPGRYEGRSQLCAELAIAFAQLGRRTLLVDADLRHPRQHVLFSSDNQWGLSQALAQGDSPYLNTVEGLPQLTLLTSGPVPHNPLELLSQSRFERLTNSLGNQYDFIVIDTPAVSQCADALQVASVARHVVAVSRAGVTSFQDMKDMLRRLALTDAAILGAVFNKF